MSQLKLVALIVHDYDAAIRFFVDVLQFELVEDSPYGTRRSTPRGGDRRGADQPDCRTPLRGKSRKSVATWPQVKRMRQLQEQAGVALIGEWARHRSDRTRTPPGCRTTPRSEVRTWRSLLYSMNPRSLNLFMKN